jgi:flagellar biosynthesis protein FliQ
VVALLVILLPWMLRTMIEFTRGVLERIPSMVN